MAISTALGISKPEVYETAKIRLTSSMLHIGSEVGKLSPFEYVETPDRVYLPNSDLLARELLRRGRLNEYIGNIERRESITDILETSFGEDWPTFKTKEGDRIFPTHLSSRNWVEGKITDLRPMIRNGMGQLYIPGSSIKGAIRTAIAYYLLKHDDQYHIPQNKRRSEIEKQLQASMGDLKRKAKFYDDKAFMDELFTNFSLTGNRGSDKTGPNTDFMRAIHVTDSEPLVTKTLTAKNGKKQIVNVAVVGEVAVSSHYEDWKAKSRASIYAELVTNARTEFTITLDHELLAKFRHKNGMGLPFESLDQLLKICQDFAQEQWDLEAAYWEKIGYSQGLNFDLLWEKYYEKPDCDYHLRLGWGTGMMGTTVGSLFDPELRSQIRDTCGLKAPGFEAPKSRRTVKNSKGELRYPLGWVKFKKL